MVLLSNRKLCYDYIRILACFLVILNHTSSIFDKFYKLPFKTWIFAALLFFICKMAVPFFVMLSGALLLGKEESYVKIFIHRVLRIILALIAWSIIYKETYYIYYHHKLLSFQQILLLIKSIKNQPVSTHFWYLYMLVGLYFMTPFIRKMIQNFEQRDYVVFLTFWCVFACVLPFISIIHPVKYSSYFQVPLFTGYVGYYIAGYFLDKIKINKSIIIFCIFAIIIGLSISILCTLYFIIAQGKSSRILDNVLLFPIVLNSFASFILMRYFSDKLNIKTTIKNVIVYISNATFGIYLIHMLIIFLFSQTIFFKHLLAGYSNSIIQTLIFDLIIFLLSFIIVAIMRKIPFIKYIV